MCGRFTLTTDQKKLIDFLPGLKFTEPSLPRYIAPAQPVATVLNEDARRLTLSHWGLIPSWAKDRSIGNRMINARAETVQEKPSFRVPFRRMRCLILADGFYEWKREPGRRTKLPYYFRLKSGKPFAFAGLWDRWREPSGKDLTTCTIITTSANATVEPVHHRMPVILLSDHYEPWLAPEEQKIESLLACLKPYPAEEMESCVVSTRVNNPSIDEPSCIHPQS